MTTTITLGTHDHAEWDRHNLDSALDMDCAEFRNEQDSGHGDQEGEWFATSESHYAPGIGYFHVLFTGTHGNDHSPGTSGNTQATLYDTSDPDDMAEFRADVAEWEGKPESLDDDAPEDDESDDIPNLDAMDASELREWVIPTSIPEPARTDLAAYSLFKAAAIDRRKRGDIQDALSLERQCDEVYQQLPEQYRW